MSIIQNYKFITPNIKLLNDEYWDFILTPPNSKIENGSSKNNNVISHINFE